MKNQKNINSTEIKLFEAIIDLIGSHRNDGNNEIAIDEIDRYSKLNQELLKPNESDIELVKIKDEIKDKFVNNFEDSIEDLKLYLSRERDIFDDILKLQRRFNRINNYLIKGLIEFSKADMELTKIENAYIFIINNLEKKDLKKYGG